MASEKIQEQEISIELTDEELDEVQGGGLYGNLFRPFPHGVPSDFFKKSFQQPVLPVEIPNLNVQQFG